MSHAIALPSISQIHAGVDPVLVNRYQLGNAIAQGAPYAPNSAESADQTVAVLRAIQPSEPTVTPAVVATAANRAFKIREVAADTEFPGQGNAAMMALLRQIRDDLTEVRAAQYNIRVTRSNAREDAAGRPLVLRRKEISGHGVGLMNALRGHLQAPQVPANIPAVNTLPMPALSTDTSNLDGGDILQYILFYNEDFGITAADSLGTRREKVRRWLTG